MSTSTAGLLPLPWQADHFGLRKEAIKIRADLLKKIEAGELDEKEARGHLEEQIEHERSRQAWWALLPNFPANGYRNPDGNPPRPEQLAFVKSYPEFGNEHTKLCDELGIPEPKGLLLFGESGSGKTTAAVCALWNAIFEGSFCDPEEVQAWSAVRLGNAISDAARIGGETLSDLTSNLEAAALLFIDDLDKARFTDRVQDELFNLFEFRERNFRPLIITTNVNGRGLAKKFEASKGKPIVNRLARMCWAVDFDDDAFSAAEAQAVAVADMRYRLERAAARRPQRAET